MDQQDQEDQDDEVDQQDQEDRSDQEDQEGQGDQEDDEAVESTSESIPEKSYLVNYFRKLQARLSQEQYPSEYARGTFWIEPMMTYFLLKKTNKPEAHYQPRVFLWVPHLLLAKRLEELHCPTCKSNVQ